MVALLTTHHSPFTIHHNDGFKKNNYRLIVARLISSSRITIHHTLVTLRNKKAPYIAERGFFKIGRRPTLPHVTAVPSALAGLTSLFGMGRGGHRRYRHLNIFNVG